MAAQNLVERALDIVSYLADYPEGRSVTAIANDLRIPPSTTHRLLGSLSGSGFVDQDPHSHDYVLSLKLSALGVRYLSGMSFMDACRPAMDSLADKTRELVRLAVVTGDELVWIAKAQGSRSSLRLDPLEGRSAVPHVTAAGKAWLGSMPNDAIVKRFTSLTRGKVRYGPNAHTGVHKFLAELETSRRRGFATTYEEAEPGIAAVGAVIRDGNAKDATVVATISVAGPTVRLTRKDLEPIGFLVSKAALELSAVWPATHHLIGEGPTTAKRRKAADSA